MVRLLSVTCESLQATHEHVTWEKVGTRAVMQGTADLRVSRAQKGSHFLASTVKDETERASLAAQWQQRRRHGFNP